MTEGGRVELLVGKSRKWSMMFVDVCNILLYDFDLGYKTAIHGFHILHFLLMQGTDMCFFH